MYTDTDTDTSGRRDSVTNPTDKPISETERACTRHQLLKEKRKWKIGGKKYQQPATKQKKKERHKNQ